MILLSCGQYTSLTVVQNDGKELIVFRQYLQTAIGDDKLWYCPRSGVAGTRYEIIDVTISGGSRFTGTNEFLRVLSEERSSLVWVMNQSIWATLSQFENGEKKIESPPPHSRRCICAIGARIRPRTRQRMLRSDVRQ